ncbi:MAG: hypothetical protein AAB116_20150 [Candidatus Poribacteria bacterium]
MKNLLFAILEILRCAQNDVFELRNGISSKLNDIEEKLSLIEDRLAIPENGDIMTEQRNKNEDDITREEAKLMIIELFNKKKELDYIEIMSSLNLDLAQIVEICEELERENKIEGMELRNN